ncbi:MAG: ABC transporter substrate-binding protein [Acidimicrobiia bacterium]
MRHRSQSVVLVVVVLVAAACSTGPIADADIPDPSNWDEVVARARGQTVNLFMWGGSSQINRFVDTVYAPLLEDDFDITLNRVPVADTVDAINTILAELQGGRGRGGSVDLVWVNGENFLTLRQADALLTDWATSIPNARLVDWDSPEVNQDFGLAVNGAESPWGSAQFQFVYDGARTTVEELPHSYVELRNWVEAHPGRFTYPAPPDFHGTRFIKQAFYEVTGGVESWLLGFDETAYDAAAVELWSYLTGIEPFLWRGGTTYPQSLAELNRLFANGEVDFTFTQLPAGIGANIASGVLPATAKPFVFDTGSIGDSHYLAIPNNAAHPHGAMVVANLVLDPELQAAKFDPANGWGDGLAISLSRLEATEQSSIAKVTAGLSDLAVPPDRLQATRLPEVSAEYTIALERDWDFYVRQN